MSEIDSLLLKPCPFCGAEVKWESEDGKFIKSNTFFCSRCDAEVTFLYQGNSLKYADSWNSRKVEDERLKKKFN